MSKFKAGDIVKCIDSSQGAQASLTKGTYYTVINGYSDQVDLDIQGGQGWWQERFQLVQANKSLEDAWDEPDSVPWTEAATNRLAYKYPETKPIVAKKTVEQLAIDALYNTTGKVYTEREIMSVVSIVNSIKELENV